MKLEPELCSMQGCRVFGGDKRDFHVKKQQKSATAQGGHKYKVLGYFWGTRPHLFE